MNLAIIDNVIDYIYEHMYDNTYMCSCMCTRAHVKSFFSCRKKENLNSASSLSLFAFCKILPSSDGF